MRFLAPVFVHASYPVGCRWAVRRTGSVRKRPVRVQLVSWSPLADVLSHPGDTAAGAVAAKLQVGNISKGLASHLTSAEGTGPLLKPWEHRRSREAAEALLLVAAEGHGFDEPTDGRDDIQSSQRLEQQQIDPTESAITTAVGGRRAPG